MSAHPFEVGVLGGEREAFCDDTLLSNRFCVSKYGYGSHNLGTDLTSYVYDIKLPLVSEPYWYMQSRTSD